MKFKPKSSVEDVLRMLPMLRQVFVFLSFAALVTGCTREVPKNSKLTLQLPSAPMSLSYKVGTLSSPSWNVTAPANYSQIACYAVVISNSSDERFNCLDSSGNVAFEASSVAGLYPAGSLIKVDNLSAGDTQIYLLAFSASSSAACSSVGSGGEGLQPNELSMPLVVDQANIKIGDGENYVKMSVPSSLVGLNSVGGCAKYLIASGGGGITPTPSPSPTASPSPTPSPSPSPTPTPPPSAPNIVSITIPNNIHSLLVPNIVVSVVFSESVVVAGGGTPTIGLNIGGPTRQASYLSGSGSTLQFQYSVIPGDNDMDGIDIAANAIALNGGTIKNSAGTIDANLSHAAQPFASVLADTLPPTAPSIILNSGAAYASMTTVNVDLSATDGPAAIFLTEDPTCMSGGSWNTYSSTAIWILSATDGMKTVYVKFRDSVGNESSCISDSIVLDMTPPTPPSAPNVAAPPFTLTQTPPINWSASSDANGVAGYQIQLRELDNTIIQPWQPMAPGPYIPGPSHAVTGLALILGKNYFAEIRAVDNAGNVSAPATTNYWTALDGPPFFEQLTLGVGHTCGKTNLGRIKCWGQGIAGQLGQGSLTNSLLAVLAGNINEPVWLQASARGFSTCGIQADNSLYCWGDNFLDQLGLGGLGTGPFSMPQPIATGGSWVKVAVGESHSCGIKTDGTLHCWGSNGAGQLGTGTFTASNVPVPVSGGLNFSDVAIGSNFTCGVTMSGNLHCWGNDSSGQLGNGAGGASSLPAASILSGVTQVSAGSQHACARTSASQIYCWGNQLDGRVGNNVGSSFEQSPVTVNGGGSWMMVAAGSDHTCGIRSDMSNRVYCWGKNNYGQLGDNTTTSRLIPTLTTDASPYFELSSGTKHTCGIVQGSKLLRCWGDNVDGQLGNGNSSPSFMPINSTVDPL